ncbi:hypothetical protein [Pedobacter steynii]
MLRREPIPEQPYLNGVIRPILTSDALILAKLLTFSLLEDYELDVLIHDISGISANILGLESKRNIT